MSKLAIYFLLLGSVVAERDTTPVFILDYDKTLKHVDVNGNPFDKMKSSDFSKIVDDAIKLSHIVIIFVEDSFCSEDISIKDKHGSPYYHLSVGLKEKQVKYLPAVSQPYNTLKRKLPPKDVNIFYLSDGNAQLNLYDHKLDYYYIYFKDNKNDSRASKLRGHDLSMKEVLLVMHQIAKKPTIGFYTGKFNPVMVEKINFKSVKTYPVHRHPGVTISSSGALFRFVGVYSTIGNRRSMFSQIPLVTEESWQKHQLVTRMAYTDFELEFTFDFQTDRWIVESVALLEGGEEVGRTPLRAGAPWSWSYTCSEPLVLVNLRDGSALTISHYQIQPFKNNYLKKDDEGGVGGDDNLDDDPLSDPPGGGGGGGGGSSSNSTKFGKSINCGPYFNAPILAGLMVTAFCISILTYGVVSMYNLRANDRYDDQHGKPLVIAAEAGH
ncbi:putative vacuolar ATP synthase subunit S1 [Danaus plexippus plexippus]|uniref:Vacuolar ATP synthase subunit S1 n=1 Tax=Danaus plexippus plexippus TaxID=278856 RepID=A0A212ESQ4_DANPL|nr:putative vacuolar ATP synthase subunit S1 [Danaus plexippus plexippus]